MTRGKHGAQAARARDAAACTQEIESYRHAVQRLSRENEELTKRLQDETRHHAADVKALKAQLAEGLSPEVVVLKEQNMRLREQRDVARARARQIQRVRESEFGFVVAYVMEKEGFATGHAAVEWLMSKRVYGDMDANAETLLAGETGPSARKRPGAAAVIQKARGIR